MKKIALISLCCVALFTACSDESSSSAKDSIADTDIIAKTHDDLPVCSDTLEGTFAYVKDEKQGYTCHSKTWTPEEPSQESSSSKAEDDSNSETSSSGTNDIQEPTSSAADESSSHLITIAITIFCFKAEIFRHPSLRTYNNHPVFFPITRVRKK